MSQEVDDCRKRPRDGVGRLRKLIPLEAVNTTHGMFHVVIENITHDTQYCLRVELGTLQLFGILSSFRVGCRDVDLVSGSMYLERRGIC